jgi:septum formation protein
MPVHDNNTHLVLASGSPRRKDLLAGLKLRFEVVPSEIDESLMNGEQPADHVRRLALEKASEVAVRFPDKWTLGADTIVVINGEILGKPADEDEARRMLSKLAGRTHEVHTGYALVLNGHPELRRIRSVLSRVYIRELSPTEIADYVRTGEPMDKAGAYAIQGIGSGIVERIQGSYTNVVGLPLCEVAKDLQELGIYDFLKNDSKNA